MNCALIFACLLAVALSSPLPERYSIRRPHNSVNLHSTARRLNSRGRQFSVSLERDSREFDVTRFAGTRSSRFNLRLDDDSRESDEISIRCPKGQLPHLNRCVVPRINRNIFVFGKEDDSTEEKSFNQDLIPLPEIDYNIIFVRSKPQRPRAPVIIPPPQKKTVVYVLEDEQESAEDIIEVPSLPETDPEVYYVKVKEGENPQLPGGIDLQTAYSQAIRPLQDVSSRENSLELTISPSAAGGLPGGFRDDDSLPFGGPSDFGGQSNFGGPSDFGSPSDFGVPLPDPNAGSAPQFNSGDIGVPLPDPGLGAADFGSVGVPLPDIRSNDGGFGGGAGFSSGFSPASGVGRTLDVDIDEGRIKIEPKSREVVRSALRYSVPNKGK